MPYVPTHDRPEIDKVVLEEAKIICSKLDKANYIFDYFYDL